MGFPVISSKIKTRPRLPKAKGFFGNSNYFLATYYAENSNENNSVLTDDRLPSSNFKGLRRGVGREIFTIVFSPIVFGLLLSPRKKKNMKIPRGIPGGAWLQVKLNHALLTRLFTAETHNTRYCWFARDVTAAILVVWEKKRFNTLRTKLLFHVNSSTKKFHRIDHQQEPITFHQHGLIVMWSQPRIDDRCTLFSFLNKCTCFRFFEVQSKLESSGVKLYWGRNEVCHPWSLNFWL